MLQAQAPYQDYDKLSGRFVSEFGSSFLQSSLGRTQTSYPSFHLNRYGSCATSSHNRLLPRWRNERSVPSIENNGRSQQRSVFPTSDVNTTALKLYLYIAGGHERRLASYIAENLRTANSLDGYIYATQFIQAEALSTAFSSWRRLFRGGVEEAYCAGALVWQLNDVVSLDSRFSPFVSRTQKSISAVALHFVVNR